MRIVLPLAIALAGCVEQPDPIDTEPPPMHEPPPLGIGDDGTPDDDHLLVHEEFTASYNRYLNAANWVQWVTVARDFGPVDRFDGDFYADELLPAGWFRPSHADMYGSGFDRGHMVRSEERTSTDAENYATFVMSNVLPQRADLNRGPWFDFELYVQRRVKSTSAPVDAYQIAGPVWPVACMTHALRAGGDGCNDVGRSSDVTHHIAVPEATFKIVVFVPAGTALADAVSPEVMVVLMPNVDGIADVRWWSYQSNIPEVEARTGYDWPTM